MENKATEVRYWNIIMYANSIKAITATVIKLLLSM